jgi:KipI family sensor histidine kinase inhibitor
VNARVLPYGPAHVLVEVATSAQVADLSAWLAHRSIPGVRTLLPAARTVLIGVEAGAAADVADALAGYVAGASAMNEELPASAVVQVSTVYDGEDLRAVADACGIGIDEVVRRHSAPTYTVAFCGFSPGFAYLIGGDPALELPRRADPRTRVPASSVAIAGEYSAVYPAESPGGWHLLGHALVRVWSIDRDPPALLPPGTRVRFVATRSGGAS